MDARHTAPNAGRSLARCRGSLVLVLLLAGSAGASAQPAAYLPLDVGNSWTYFEVLEPPNAPPDTLWKGSYAVVEATSVHDTLYYVFDVPFGFAGADTLRADAVGRIWARMEGRDVLLFDFSLGDGETYRFQAPRLPDITFQVTVERGRTVDVGAGRFDDCLTLFFDDPEWADEERSFTFAPGVGIVRMYGGLGDYAELYAAVVGGQVITAVEAGALPGRRAVRAWAYPNPFRTSTTLVVPVTGSQRPTAAVHDALGRRVATLQADACTPDRCTFSWDGAHLPGGVYYVRISPAARVPTVALILSR